MSKFEIWKRGNVYEVMFREGEGISCLSRSRSLDTAKKRLAYHRKRSKKFLLREDSSVWTTKINRKAKLERVL